jgi:hypothetical protein
VANSANTTERSSRHGIGPATSSSFSPVATALTALGLRMLLGSGLFTLALGVVRVAGGYDVVRLSPLLAVLPP